MNNYVTNANAETLMSAIGNKIKDTKSTATANSDDIALTDSADARVHDLKIYGKTAPSKNKASYANGVAPFGCI